MEHIQGVTACLLNGNVDVEALSKAQPKPTRPTHSRQGSRAGTFHALGALWETAKVMFS